MDAEEKYSYFLKLFLVIITLKTKLLKSSLSKKKYTKTKKKNKLKKVNANGIFVVDFIGIFRGLHYLKSIHFLNLTLLWITSN